MGLADVTRAGVLAAVSECRYLGRDAFRRRHRFGRATVYELVLDGGRYDSKAVAGVAHLYSTGTLLTADGFIGGARTVVRRLRALGFIVEEGATAPETSELVVPQLVLQPRGGSRVRGPQNFTKSVRQGIRISDFRDVLGDQADVLAALYPDGIARLWGATPTRRAGNEKAKALRDRRVGDEVLFYADTRFIARARILHLFHSPSVARTVWGTDEEGATWEHIMALGDVEEFPDSIEAAPILRNLNVPVPLRSLTLRSAEDYRRVAHLLPPRRRPLPPHPLAAPAVASASLTVAGLLERIDTLHTRRTPGAEPRSRGQALALLWAISRIAADRPRLAPWSHFRAEFEPLLAKFGLPGFEAGPEYFFCHLQDGGLWEVHGIPGEAGSMPHVEVLDTVQPVAGLTCEAADLLRNPVTRLEAVVRLCGARLEGIDQRVLFDRVGLAGYTTANGRPGDAEDDGGEGTAAVERVAGPAERQERLSSRLVRDTALAKRVKELHDHACQVCGIRLRYNRKPYNQAAHIRGLGSPHDGPDELPNLLCLCPNHHTLFDGLEIYIDADGVVRQAQDDESLGPLRRHPDHPIDEAHLRYHRTLCTLNA